MSDKKTIQINPDLFKVSEKNTTRKKTPKPKIEMKSSFRQQKQKTLRKNVLKMIREKQQETYRDLFDTKKPKPAEKPYKEATDFNKEFDDSLKFFSSLSSKVESEKTESCQNPIPQNIPHNTTFKNYESLGQPVNPLLIDPVVNVELPRALLAVPTETAHINERVDLPQPKYGCLKNGTLPTYRTFTRKNSEPLAFVEPKKPDHSMDMIMKKFETLHKGQIKKPEKKERRIKYLKRKKIFKRTYHIGRCKSGIGVLVSNKTIRSRISTEAQLLKQTPIHDVRKFLIKRGFIKVGTNAPNDVLRKMYESVSLVCGEVQNHNQENLLYNFINDTE